MKVELLYLEGCPGYEELVPRVRELVGARAALEPRRIESVEQAEAERFLGSPTVRVDGVDVDPTAAGRTDFGMKCRLYRTSGGQRHTPPDEWVRRAVDAAG